MYAQCFSIKAGRNTILSFQRISNQTDSARVRESPSEYQPTPSGAFYSQSAFLTLLIGILSHDKSTEIDFKEFLFKKQIRKIFKLKCRESASQDPILLAAQFNNIHLILEIFSFQTKSNLSYVVSFYLNCFL